MEEGVEALVGGEVRGHGEHQRGVDHGEDGELAGVDEAGLLVAVVVGDDGAGVDLAAGAGGGGDADQREGGVGVGLVAAGGGVGVVPEVAGVAGHHADHLGGVHHGAAAQGDDEVAAFGLGERGAFHHGGAERVGLDLGEFDDGGAGLGELREQAVVGAGGLGGLAAGHHEEALLAGEFLLAEFVERAGPEEQARGDVVDEIRGCHEVNLC